MNTRIAPFDSEDARRAVSFALDRNEIRQASGTVQFAEPTCQILPPNFPSYEPYCPFTLPGPNAGTWHAADLVSARKLVARSHTRGMRVTVLSPSDTYSQRTAGYLVQLLDRLGYRASRRHVPFDVLSRSPSFSGSRSNMQIALVQWFADYPSASGFIKPSFVCHGPANDSGFCDPRLDEEMRKAEALESTDPRSANTRWAHIDRQLVDAAAWIPYSNGEALDFVSKRVGNFQFHPTWGPLLDQLWVR
jgi:peptide/nickel transport system substrate-binding protein